MIAKHEAKNITKAFHFPQYINLDPDVIAWLLDEIAERLNSFPLEPGEGVHVLTTFTVEFERRAIRAFDCFLAEVAEGAYLTDQERAVLRRHLAEDAPDLGDLAETFDGVSIPTIFVTLKVGYRTLFSHLRRQYR